MLSADADRALGEQLALTLLKVEGVTDPSPFHLNNTGVYIHRLPASALQTAASAQAKTVRVQIITPPEAISRGSKATGEGSHGADEQGVRRYAVKIENLGYPNGSRRRRVGHAWHGLRKRGIRCACRKSQGCGRLIEMENAVLVLKQHSVKTRPVTMQTASPLLCEAKAQG